MKPAESPEFTHGGGEIFELAADVFNSAQLTEVHKKPSVALANLAESNTARLIAMQYNHGRQVTKAVLFEKLQSAQPGLAPHGEYFVEHFLVHINKKEIIETRSYFAPKQEKERLFDASWGAMCIELLSEHPRSNPQFVYQVFEDYAKNAQEEFPLNLDTQAGNEITHYLSREFGKLLKI